MEMMDVCCDMFLRPYVKSANEFSVREIVCCIDEIEKAKAVAKEHCDTINDQDTLEELLTIIRNEKGRIEAPEGGHDDQMMSLAITHEIREQVVFVQEPINVYPHFNFGVEKKWETQYDYGNDISIV